MLCVDDQAVSRPGVFVESRVKPYVSSVLCLTIHGGAELSQAGAQSAFVTSASTVTFWCGFYSRSVLARGFQPYDQPAATAHMPLPFTAFERHTFSDTGTLFIERHPRTEQMRRLVVDDGHHRRFRTCAFEDSQLFGEEIGSFFGIAGVAPSLRPRATSLVVAAYRRALADEQITALRASSRRMKSARPAAMGATAAESDPPRSSRPPQLAVGDSSDGGGASSSPSSGPGPSLRELRAALDRWV